MAAKTNPFFQSMPKQRQMDKFERKVKRWIKLGREIQVFLKILAKEKLFKEFKRLEKELGKVPTSSEFYKNTNYSSYPIKKLFGTWTNFQIEIGYKTIWKKEDIIKEFKRIEKKLNKVPFLFKFCKYTCHSEYPIRKLFGTWSNLLVEMGHKPARRVKHPSKEKLIDYYFKLKQKLGRQPRVIDIQNKNTKHNFDDYKRIFGSWNKFLKYVNEPILFFHLGITNEEIIKRFIKYFKEKRDFPIRKDIIEDKNISSVKRFGSYEKLEIRILGFKRDSLDWNILRWLKIPKKRREQIRKEIKTAYCLGKYTEASSLGFWLCRTKMSFKGFLKEADKSDITWEKLFKRLERIERSLSSTSFNKNEFFKTKA